MKFEERLQNVFAEVQASAGIEVLEAKPGKARPDLPDAATVFEWIARRGITLDSTLQRCYAPISGTALHWRVREGKANDGGEFAIYNIYDAVVAPAPRLWSEKTSPEERAFLEQLHPIDHQPHAGEGKFVALHIEHATSSPRLWFYRLTEPRLELDIDYCGYLDALLVTKGYYGWQHLFADVDLRTRELAFYQTQLTRMLELLPRLFPDHDYAPLRDRLAARTKGKRGRK